jgi:hypothetical protein
MRGTDQIIYVLVRDRPGHTRFAEWGEHPSTGATGPVAMKSIADAEEFRATIRSPEFTIQATTMAELIALVPVYGWRDLWTPGSPDGKGGGTMYAMSLLE